MLNQAQGASTATAHAAIYEQMALKNSEYYLEKETGKFDGNLIDYLKDEKKVIKEVAEVDGYVIDVVALTGEKQKYGNGTDGKTDVYKLEEAILETSTNKKYNVIYCKTESDKEILGTLEDNAKNEDLITFTIDGVSFTARKGMTWKDWVNSDYCKTDWRFDEVGGGFFVKKDGDWLVIRDDAATSQDSDTVILAVSYTTHLELED